jgi:hypothetical protein
MAIINFSYGFICVHVPKSAGTTVSYELARYTRYCDLEIGGTEYGEQFQEIYSRRFKIYKHSTMAEIGDVIGQEQAKKFFRFAFVREPLSRALSTYHFLRKWQGSGQFGQEVLNFPTFESFVMSDLWASSDGPDRILRPQATWLTDPNNPESLVVDYAGKIENFDADLAEIITRIGLPGQVKETEAMARLGLPAKAEHNDMGAIVVRNATGEYEKPQEASFGVRERIHNRYKLDYALFKY